MFCPRCGTQAADGAQFCSSCGAPLSQAQPCQPGNLGQYQQQQQYQQQVQQQYQQPLPQQHQQQQYQQPGQPANLGQLQQTDQPTSNTKSNKGVTIAAIAIAAVVVIGIIVAIVFMLPQNPSTPATTSSNRTTGGSSAATATGGSSAATTTGGSSAATTTSNSVSLADIMTMSNDKLVSALKSNGFVSDGTQPITADHQTLGMGDVYVKGNTTVVVAKNYGMRIVLVDASNPYDYLKSKGASFSKLGAYQNNNVELSDWAVGVFKGDGGEWVAVANENEICMVAPGHMDMLKRYARNYPTSSSMSANDAAVAVANDFASGGYSNVKGDKIHTVTVGSSPTGGTSAGSASGGVSESSAKAVCGHYEDTRGGANDDHGEYKNFNVFQNNHKTYVELTWYPPTTYGSNTENQLKNYRVILNAEITLYEQGGAICFRMTDGKANGATMSCEGKFTNDGVQFTSGKITAELSNGQKASFGLEGVVLKKKD